MRRWLILILVLLFAVPPWAAAQERQQVPTEESAKSTFSPTESTVASRPGGDQESGALPAEQEAAVVSFVEQHQAELLELLIYLKEGLPNEYGRAIRDLARTRERLVQVEKRDPERYDLELQRWQAESRRQLLTAQFQMSHDSKLIEDIRAALSHEQQLGLALLKYERDRTKSRLVKLDEQIAKQEAAFASSIDRKVATLTKTKEPKGPEAKAKSGERKPATTKRPKKPT